MVILLSRRRMALRIFNFVDCIQQLWFLLLFAIMLLRVDAYPQLGKEVLKMMEEDFSRYTMLPPPSETYKPRFMDVVHRSLRFEAPQSVSR